MRKFGGPDAVEVLEVPVPSPAKDQVLVRVEAAPVTPVDIDTRSGELASILQERAYYPLGRSAAGAVVGVGSNVRDLAIDTQVIGWCSSLNDTYAAQADYVLFHKSCVVQSPEGVSALAASTLPLNGLTADQALDNFQPDRSVLITGAAGGVGALAVQLAVRRKLEVFATAHPADEALVRGLGAHHFIPRTANLNQAVHRIQPHGVDGILDTAVTKDITPVRDGGRFVALVVGGEPTSERGIKVSTEWTSADLPRLQKLALLAQESELVLRVGETFSLAQVASAHARFSRGRLGGHLVLVP